eukprot:TRINITY_DN10075_c0_g3_i2.p1 TRINITY_DN10075_c0_g3~~TRINITY_DN10075_c0_g3_i2.p1  ORF type:complete len:583 (-),score=123.51 TRINITY_DN10075_c0_g3_i2:400-2148(-)
MLFAVARSSLLLCAAAALAALPRAAAAPFLRIAPAAAAAEQEEQLQVEGPSRPNLVFFLTDDQDQMLGASFPVLDGQATPMPKTKKLMQDEGMHATNWYIHTPICSPSRSELLTGRYFHNIKLVGQPCYPSGMHVNHTKVDDHSFVRVLKERAGYATGLFGKYTNKMPKTTPRGYDAWLANDGGDYIGPKFHANGIDGLPNGIVSFSNDPANYSTAVIGNTSIAWIRKVAAEGRPFMAYIAPKAAHEPFNPAPWYRDTWDETWPEHEPRPENWNCSFESRKNHHGNIPKQPMLSAAAADLITGVFRNRWRTLMSVDDLIAGVINAVEELGLSESTYFFFSSDHGFQLGQFNIPMDKRHVYEWDTKIHLLARGPGIARGSSFEQPGTQVDIAPTLLGLAGLSAPPLMDGKSIAPFLLRDADMKVLAPSTREHLRALGDAGAYRSGWRREVFIEYYFCEINSKCTTGCKSGSYPSSDSWCTNLAENSVCWCGPTAGTSDCYATEDSANNFIALRRPELDCPETRARGGGGGSLYAEFQTGDVSESAVGFKRVDFVEYFEVSEDPWQLRNRAAEASRARAAARKM